MLAKKVTALLVSAALVLSLLAACGSKALSNVMADLLTGLYDNVSVEVDNDLTAALKKAVSAGGTQEEILAALIENLNLSGVSIAFSSLGSGQQGEHGVTLTFQTGNDPDAAARTALAQWASVFGSLPDNGSYSASVAMIEADNGYYIAVDVEVTRAGSTGKDDEDDKPDDYTYDASSNTYTVYTAAGLLVWAEAAQANSSTNCILAADIDLPEAAEGESNWTPICNDKALYSGTFDGNGHSITGLTINQEETSYVGLFGQFAGKVQNLKLENVDITGSSIVGGVVGWSNGGTVTGCTVSGSVSGTSFVGGVVGNNWGAVIACYSTGSVTGTSYVGGVVGGNGSGSTVTACYATGSVEGGSNVGGVVGYSSGRVTACYWSGYNGAGIGTDADAFGGDTTQITTDNAETAWLALQNAMNSNGYTITGTWDKPTGLTPYP